MTLSRTMRKSHGLLLAGQSRAHNFALEERTVDGNERLGQMFIDSATGLVRLGIPDGAGGVKCVTLADLDSLDAEAISQLSGDVEGLSELLTTIQTLAAANAQALEDAETERTALEQSVSNMSSTVATQAQTILSLTQRVTTLEEEVAALPTINDTDLVSETSTLSAKTITSEYGIMKTEAYRQARE